MVRKPDIQYVQQFYVHGTEAKVLELKPGRRIIKTILPRVIPDRSIRVAVDPIALCGIVVAVVMLVMMAVGVFQYVDAYNEHQSMMNQVISLQNQNVVLHEEYVNSFDPADVMEKAQALGMIPIEEAEVIRINPVVPVRESEPTLWEDIVWFVEGLFA